MTFSTVLGIRHKLIMTEQNKLINMQIYQVNSHRGLKDVLGPFYVIRLSYDYLKSIYERNLKTS